MDETFYTASIETNDDETFGYFTAIDRNSGSVSIPRPPAEVATEEVTA